MFHLHLFSSPSIQTIRARQLIVRVSHRKDVKQETLERLALASLAVRRQTRNRIVAVAAHFQIIGLFVPTAIAALSPLDCTVQPSGEVTLDASPDMTCTTEEAGYTTLALLAPVMFSVFAIIPILGIVYKLYGSRQELGSSSKICGVDVQWGGSAGDIVRKERELEDAVSTFAAQSASVAGSEAGSMIRRAAEGRIKKIRIQLSKLKRDEKLFDHEVFQERFGWAFAKYVDHKYYWEIVVLLRKLCIGIIVSFFTVEPLVAIPLQFLIILASICMQLRWGPYISVKNRCGVCGSGKLRKLSVRCCRGANNRIELILMSAECLLLVAGFANAAVGGTSVVGAGAGVTAGMNNQTDVLQRARALSGTGSGFTPVDSAALKAAVGTCAWSDSAQAVGCTGGCLGETDDGSCPTFAASNDATGNPYGVMGDWDVSKVTSLDNSKSTPLVSVVLSFEFHSLPLLFISRF